MERYNKNLPPESQVLTVPCQECQVPTQLAFKQEDRYHMIEGCVLVFEGRCQNQHIVQRTFEKETT